MSLSQINVNNSLVVGVDNTPTINSENLIDSNAVADLFNKTHLKEIYINPNICLYNNINSIQIAKATKVFGARDEWYCGVYFMYNNTSAGFITEKFTSQEDALNSCKGVKIYSSEDKNMYCVIDWECSLVSQGNTPIQIVPDFNTLYGKPIITQYAENGINSIAKEIYIDPIKIPVKNIESGQIVNGIKLYSTSDKYYVGAFIRYIFDNKIIVAEAFKSFDTREEALVEASGIKYYFSKNYGFIIVIDWSLVYNEQYRIDITNFSNYTKLENKPICQNIICEYSDYNIFVNAYISPDIINYTDIADFNIAKGNKIYGDRNKWYNGIVIRTNSNEYHLLVNEFDDYNQALINATGIEIFKDENSIFVINWDNNLITSDYTYVYATPNINIYNAGDFNDIHIIKEIYISPTICSYDEITHLLIAKATKIYGSQDKWYNGLYFTYIKNGESSIKYGLCYEEYDSQEEALNNCTETRVYTSEDETTIGIVIDWNYIKKQGNTDLMDLSNPSWNNIDNKSILSEVLKSNTKEYGISTEWINRYPNISDKLSIFNNKLYQAEDVNILMLGDSFFAAQTTAMLFENASNLPPQCSRNHI